MWVKLNNSREVQMITKYHFHYVDSGGIWRSACSFKGYRVHGVWYNHDAGEFNSAGLIRHRYMLAAPQQVDCKTCLKHPKLQKLLDELSPWPDPSLIPERMAAYHEYCQKHPEGTPLQQAFHAALKQGRYIDNGWDVEQPEIGRAHV